MLPPAPGRFSITMGCLRPTESLSAIVRATMSLGPPASYGTITLIGRLGYCCPATAAADHPNTKLTKAAPAKGKGRLALMFDSVAEKNIPAVGGCKVPGFYVAEKCYFSAPS